MYLSLVKSWTPLSTDQGGLLHPGTCWLRCSSQRKASSSSSERPETHRCWRRIKVDPWGFNQEIDRYYFYIFYIFYLLTTNIYRNMYDSTIRFAPVKSAVSDALENLILVVEHSTAGHRKAMALEIWRRTWFRPNKSGDPETWSCKVSKSMLGPKPSYHS